MLLKYYRLSKFWAFIVHKGWWGGGVGGGPFSILKNMWLYETKMLLNIEYAWNCQV